MSKYEIALDMHQAFIDTMKTTRWQESSARFAIAAGKPLIYKNDKTGEEQRVPDAVVPVMLPESVPSSEGGMGRYTVKRGSEEHPETQRAIGKMIADWNIPLIAEAETFYVTANMVDRWRNIKVPEGFQLQPWHLLSDSGFVWFEKEAIMELDGYDYDMYAKEWVSIRGLIWYKRPDLPDRISIIWFIDTRSPNWAKSMEANWINQSLVKAKEAGLPIEHPIHVPEDTKDQIKQYASQAPRFVVDTYGTFPLFTAWDEWGITSGHALALWLLMQQKKSRVSSVPVSRSARRRARSLPQAGDVNVIYLRREVPRDPELQDALELEWVEGRLRPRRHRVRPHWQRYHTREGVVWRKRNAFERGGEPGDRPVEVDPMFVLKR